MPDEPTREAPTGTEGIPIPTPQPSAPEQAAAHHLDAGHHHGHAQLPLFKFLDELKRRNVGRVAILYIVVSYVVLEVFEMFFHLLEMPPWTGRAAVLIAVLGFPVALLIAWAYEITPEGLKPTDDVPAKQSIRTQTGKRLDRAIFALMAISLAYFITDKFWLSKHTATAEYGPPTPSAPTAIPAILTASDKSIAVLPFVDMSETKDQEYLGDGMAEEILDVLARIPGLTIIGRTSSFQFKGRNEDLRTVGAKLGVEYVVEGSIRRSGNMVRVTAQLINCRSGAHQWSDSYDRSIGNILQLQRDVGLGIARALQVAVGAEATSVRQDAMNPEAYALYLKGRSAFDRFDGEGFEQAEEFFNQAIALDPKYARATVLLGTVKTMQAWFGFSASPADGFVRGRALVAQALAIDPTIAEGHAMLALIDTIYNRDWELAQRESTRALEIQPNNAIALLVAGQLAATLGQWDAALSYLSRMKIVDPLEPSASFTYGLIQYRAGNLAKAEALIRQGLNLSPSYVSGYVALAKVLLARHQPEAALAAAELEQPVGGKLAGLALSYSALGRRAESASALRRFVVESGTAYPFATAEVYAYLGDNNAAFVWLDRSFSQRDPELSGIKGDPLFAGLKSDPRYKALLRRMKLPE